jgi:hypothetical protein
MPVLTLHVFELIGKRLSEEERNPLHASSPLCAGAVCVRTRTHKRENSHGPGLAPGPVLSTILRHTAQPKGPRGSTE